MEYTQDSLKEWYESGKWKLETTIWLDAWGRIPVQRQEEIAAAVQHDEPRDSLGTLTRDELVGFDYLAKETAMVLAAGGVLITNKES